jgi:hypothetical protein
MRRHPVEPLTPALLARLHELRGWTPEAIERLGVGFDGERVTFPVRAETGEFVGHVRYQPNPERLNGRPKMLADPGTTRELFPPPEDVADDEAAGLVFLVEGEPDALRLWSLGLVAIAVPGAQNWSPNWAPRFSGRHWRVVVVFDCDQAGRSNALRAARDLTAAGIDARILDIAVERDDGYDLTDLLASARREDQRREVRRMMLRCAELADRVPEVTTPATEARPPIARAVAEPSLEPRSRLALRDPTVMRPRPVSFLDEGFRHPIGMTTLLVGDGGIGKSLYSVMLAARVTQAGFGAVFASAEDDPEKTWLPRLLAAGVHLTRTRLVRVQESRAGFDWDESLRLPDHLLELEREIEAFTAETGTPVRLLVIDPLEAHLGDTHDDGNSSTRRRQALAPLEAFANRQEVHALALHHINKDTAQRASHRVLGTIANRNAPRSMLLFGVNPDNAAERVLYHDKHNVSPKSSTQVYVVEPATVLDDDGQVMPTARLVYLRDEDLDAEAIFGRAEGEAGALDEAADFLRVELAFGPKPVAEVNRDADGLGISRRTLERARKDLGVESRRVGGVGKTGHWVLDLGMGEAPERAAGGPLG